MLWLDMPVADRRLTAPQTCKHNLIVVYMITNRYCKSGVLTMSTLGKIPCHDLHTQYYVEYNSCTISEIYPDSNNMHTCIYNINLIT